MSVPQSGGPGAMLPDWHELLAAFCGHIGVEPGVHPITGWGRELAELHLARRESPLRTAEIDCRRAELVVHIDNWVGAHVYARRPYSRSLGAAVDGMAAAQVRAAWLLRGADASDERVHAAWFQLAALADDWTDLITRTDTSARPVGTPVRERRRRAAGQ